MFPCAMSPLTHPFSLGLA
uniref:Uncharacterized protein n=1 Tax=Arundo donax TaxID=35708 RepID=A0A0A9AHB8_ARUDO